MLSCERLVMLNLNGYLFLLNRLSKNNKIFTKCKLFYY
ncbi:hypothetical protein P20480_0854 [Pseudoalteromonas sp. BSi20480]|nr:hypothetical protein P20480_0854 [Pseudoalteromonas sp. BSi20480]